MKTRLLAIFMAFNFAIAASAMDGITDEQIAQDVINMAEWDKEKILAMLDDNIYNATEHTLIRNLEHKILAEALALNIDSAEQLFRVLLAYYEIYANSVAEGITTAAYNADVQVYREAMNVFGNLSFDDCHRIVGNNSLSNATEAILRAIMDYLKLDNNERGCLMVAIYKLENNGKGCLVSDRLLRRMQSISNNINIHVVKALKKAALIGTGEGRNGPRMDSQAAEKDPQGRLEISKASIKLANIYGLAFIAKKDVDTKELINGAKLSDTFRTFSLYLKKPNIFAKDAVLKNIGNFTWEKSEFSNNPYISSLKRIMEALAQKIPTQAILDGDSLSAFTQNLGTDNKIYTNQLARGQIRWDDWVVHEDDDQIYGVDGSGFGFVIDKKLNTKLRVSKDKIENLPAWGGFPVMLKIKDFNPLFPDDYNSDEDT